MPAAKKEKSPEPDPPKEEPKGSKDPAEQAAKETGDTSHSLHIYGFGRMLGIGRR